MVVLYCERASEEGKIISLAWIGRGQSVRGRRRRRWGTRGWMDKRRIHSPFVRGGLGQLGSTATSRRAPGDRAPSRSPRACGCAYHVRRRHLSYASRQRAAAARAVVQWWASRTVSRGGAARTAVMMVAKGEAEEGEDGAATTHRRWQGEGVVGMRANHGEPEAKRAMPGKVSGEDAQGQLRWGKWVRESREIKSEQLNFFEKINEMVFC
jgi:hypothetical protein